LCEVVRVAGHGFSKLGTLRQWLLLALL